MNDAESSQTAELNADHGDIDPSFGAGLRGFIIAYQSPLVHQPSKSSLHNPTVRQDFKAHRGIGALDDRDRQFGAECLDPSGESFACVAAIHPQDAEPSEPAQHPAQYHLGSVAFGGAGWGYGHAEHQSQSIHQQMPLPAFDPFAGIIAHTAAVTSGLHALTVQNRCRGTATLAVSVPHERAQRVVERGPLVVADPLSEDMVNGFPSGKVAGQITPRATTFDEIQDGIQDAPPINGWASAFGGFGEHGLEVSPLGVGEVGVVRSDFHRPTGAAANESCKTRQSNQALCSFIWRPCPRKHPGFLFQTCSKRLKTRLKEDAPPLLYGCGDLTLLEKGGLAVVGSRHVDEELISYTEGIGKLAAEAHRTLISGGAKGIDKAAINGALQAGGESVAVMSDSLERAAVARENLEPLMDHRLLVVSPYDPAAGFNVGNAMQRNKVIYALADAGLVVTSDFEKGGTWTGAIEQLERFHFVPVFVRNGTNEGRGNAALIHHGGRPWPNPENGAELGRLLSTVVELVAAEPKQEALSFALREQPVAYISPVKPVEAVHVVVEESKIISSPAEKLFDTVREILRRELVASHTETEIVSLLGVTKPQTKEWLAKLIKQGTVEKVKKTKPVQYRVSTTSARLL